MAKNLLFIVCSLIFFECNPANNISDTPENGQTWVTIDDKEYEGSANISSRQLGEQDFIAINLVLDESTKIDILSKEFTEGLSSCEQVEVEKGCMIFSLEYDGKPFYAAKDGTLDIQELTDEKIAGEFDITVFDVTSSCLYCPGTLKELTGKFSAVKNRNNL